MKTANEFQIEDNEKRFSGSMMWPGSHVEYHHHLITHVQTYNDSLTWHQRIDIVMSWLTNKTHPANCVFIYFDEPDTTAHEYGPFSPQVMAQVKRADETISYLLDQLKEKKLSTRTNLILVSDHGMAEIK